MAHFGYAVVFIFAMIHYPTLLFLTVPAFVAYAIDLWIRYRRFGPSEIVEAASYAGITRLKIKPSRALSMQGGEFVTIGISSMDSSMSFEHHPFSISSHCDDGCFTLHIKDFGEGTWTHRLAELVSTQGETCAIPVRVDGPFGRLGVPLGSKPRSYLVGGGVGVTPLMHMVQLAIERQLNGVVFIWSIRQADMTEAFSAELLALFDQCASTGGAVSMYIYETSKKAEPTPPPESSPEEDHPLMEPLLPPEPSSELQVPVHVGPAENEELPTMGNTSSTDHVVGTCSGKAPVSVSTNSLKISELPETLPGRPPLKKLLVAPQGGDPSDVAVYTCGPAPMVASVEQICLDEGFLCHVETFEF